MLPKKKKQAAGYLKQFRSSDTDSTENKAGKAIDKAIRDIIPEELAEVISTKLVISMIHRVESLKAEHPKSYREMVEYLANDKPIGKLKPSPNTIVRYILTTLPGFDPIAALKDELEEEIKCSMKKKKASSKKRKPRTNKEVNK